RSSLRLKNKLSSGKGNQLTVGSDSSAVQPASSLGGIGGRQLQAAVARSLKLRPGGEDKSKRETEHVTQKQVFHCLALVQRSQLGLDQIGRRVQVGFAQRVRLLDADHAAVHDADSLLRLRIRRIRWHLADRVDHVEAADDFAEHYVMLVEPASFGQGDVELRAVGVRAVVGHGNPAGAAVRQDKGLIVECLAEDAGSAGAVLAHHVAHLNDEVRHNAMHRGVLCSTSPLADFQPRASDAKFIDVAGASSPNTATVNRPVKSSPGPSRSLISISNQTSSVTVYFGLATSSESSEETEAATAAAKVTRIRAKRASQNFAMATAMLVEKLIGTSAPGSHVCSVGVFVCSGSWLGAEQCLFLPTMTASAGATPGSTPNRETVSVLCSTAPSDNWTRWLLLRRFSALWINQHAEDHRALRAEWYRDCDSLTSDRRWNYSMSAVWFYQRCGNVGRGLTCATFCSTLSDKASIWLVKKHANSTRACTEFEADSSYNSKWFEAMAVSYASQIYTDDRLFFVRLLFRWAGSVWQLLWIDYLIFTLMYVGLAVLYFNLLYTHAELKATFEVTVAWLKAIRTSVPLSFMLGFFVSAVFGRWWSVCTSIPWLHSSSFYCQALVDSPKTSRSDLARKLRITVLRYLNLAWILMMAGVSLHIKERFGYWQPKWRKFQLTWQRRLQLINSDSKVQKYFGQLVTDKEMQAFAKSAELSNDNDHSYDPEYWLPLMWATRLIRRAKNLGCIADERQYLFLVNIINNFRGDLGTVWMYTEFNIPLVYTQVAVTAVYLFLASTLISTQLVDSDILLLENFPSRNGTVTRTLGLNLLSYLPVIGSLEFIFYLGWFKIGMCLLNPMGKDKADIPMSDILNSNLKASVKIGGAEDSIFPGGLTDSGEAEEAQVAEFLRSFDFTGVHAHDKFGSAEQTERQLRKALFKRLQGRGADWLHAAESAGGALLRRGAGKHSLANGRLR
uniref:Bestrophin homolog n=1 Tax=Macrostomum lignano TaxID=282301 RepID=A0A1I8IXU8_9PLAT